MHVPKEIFVKFSQDLLLNKYFFAFLHWDQPVRNEYHHLLLYKMVTINRSKLYESDILLHLELIITLHNTANAEIFIGAVWVIPNYYDSFILSSSNNLTSTNNNNKW
ncbi:hypothetical protein ACTFIZ_004888 [Dictyostelium cf. discoideum]